MAGCLLNIFGVIMFLRVSFMVGQAGIIQALLIMAISAVVTINCVIYECNMVCSPRYYHGICTCTCFVFK